MSRRFLFPPVTAFLVCALFWQIPLPVMGQYIFHGFTAAGGGGITLTSSSGYIAPSCNNLATCTIFSSLSVAAHSSIVIYTKFCWGIVASDPTSCVSGSLTNAAVTDGTNTYSYETGNSGLTGGAFWNAYVLGVTNATAGTYSLVLNPCPSGSCTGGSGTMAFVAAWYFIFSGANQTNSFDGNGIGSTYQASSPSPSVSSGNITNANEYGLCLTSTDNTLTFSAPVTVLDGTSTVATGKQTNPATGVPMVCTGTQTSGNAIMMEVALTQ